LPYIHLLYLFKELVIKKALITFLLLSACSSLALADQKEFCDGWVQGIKLVRGQKMAKANMPKCPLARPAKEGSTDFREGLKAGRKAAS
tara:strand:+ start:315 stop:581 length:267 start_codon:yes stop_codon:yes gene_type:complete